MTQTPRLGFDEAVALYDMDLIQLAQMATKVRRQKFGQKTFYNINKHINPTNVCKDVCQFCSFSASRKNPLQYTMTHEQILDDIGKSIKNGIDEVHMVSAHNSDVSLGWYMDIFAKIKAKHPKLHIKALTAAEIHFLSCQHNKTYKQIIDMMCDSGVDSMPGGGAEIFDETVRKRVCGGKVGSDDWLAIHKLWHQKGRKSNATMLFGHIENREHRIDHMMRLRHLQDNTGGFNCFIPLVYQTKNNFLNIKEPLTAIEILKTIAISRLVLDNFEHIKAYWVTSTIKLALVAQEFGADDLDGTIEKESINSAAGAVSKDGMRPEEFISLIKNSGYEPTRRDSLYGTTEPSD